MGLKPSTSIAVEINGKIYEEKASGDGQFDGFMNALHKVYKSQLALFFQRSSDLVQLGKGIPIPLHLHYAIYRKSLFFQEKTIQLLLASLQAYYLKVDRVYR